MKTKIKISFKGKNQTHLCMVIREYLKNDEVIFAEVLFVFDLKVICHFRRKEIRV